jgi:hypothetical protein
MQSSVFARPSILYQSGDAIGVDYHDAGILAAITTTLAFWPRLIGGKPWRLSSGTAREVQGHRAL